MRTFLHLIGYALLAVVLGTAVWLLRGQEGPWLWAFYLGLCMVAGAVIGRWLYSRRKAARNC